MGFVPEINLWWWWWRWSSHID